MRAPRILTALWQRLRPRRDAEPEVLVLVVLPPECGHIPEQGPAPAGGVDGLHHSAQPAADELGVRYLMAAAAARNGVRR